MGNASDQLDMEELRRLAWETTVPADGDYETQAQARIDWLAEATPEQWHSFALGFNWDDPLEPLMWIVRQSDCDMATALTVFWRSVPGWDLMKLANGEKVYVREEAPLIEYIANRIGKMGYQRRKIAWNADPDMVQDYKSIKGYLAKIENPPWSLSRAMIRSIGGREVVDSVETWAARPEGVRAGFWFNLPPSDIVTPRMELAEDKLHDALFYSFALGSGLAMLLAFADKLSEYGLHFGVLLGIMGWWVFKLLRNTSLVRGLVRAEGNAVPQAKGRAVFALLFLLGILTFEFYAEVLTPEGSRDPTTQQKIIEYGMLGLLYGGVWFGLMRAAAFISRRILFR